MVNALLALNALNDSRDIYFIWETAYTLYLYMYFVNNLIIILYIKLYSIKFWATFFAFLFNNNTNYNK